MLRWWLAAGVAVYVAVTVLNAIHLSILDADSFAGSEAVAASDERLAAGGAAVLATLLVSVLLWLAWFHRAYRNLESLEPIGLRFGTGWAVGAWFVPILNLFRPKQIANDIWRLTEPEPPPGRAWTDRPVAPLVHWWWASWLVAGLLGNLSARAVHRRTDAWGGAGSGPDGHRRDDLLRGHRRAGAAVRARGDRAGGRARRRAGWRRGRRRAGPGR